MQNAPLFLVVVARRNQNDAPYFPQNKISCRRLQKTCCYLQTANRAHIMQLKRPKMHKQKKKTTTNKHAENETKKTLLLSRPWWLAACAAVAGSGSRRPETARNPGPSASWAGRDGHHCPAHRAAVTPVARHRDALTTSSDASLPCLRGETKLREL